jgi:hypothetical protein
MGVHLPSNEGPDDDDMSSVLVLNDVIGYQSTVHNR